MSTQESSICPDCESEFVPGIAECSDCGIPLVDALPSLPRLSSAEGLCLLATKSSFPLVRSFAEALDLARIAHHLSRVQFTGSGVYGDSDDVEFNFFVAEVDLERAQTLLAVFEESPSAHTTDVVALAGQREWGDPFADESAEPEFRAADFEGPDLTPPEPLEKRVALLRGSGWTFGFVTVVLLGPTIAGDLPKVSWIFVAISSFEFVRRVVKARRLLIDWRRGSTSA